MRASELVSMQFEPGAAAPAGTIPLCVPHIAGNEWEYVKQCLDTNWVSSAGPFVTRFEQMARDVIGTREAVATVNGTAALHVALLVAGIQPDDEVLVSDLTFIAPANAIRYAGAWPVFIDAEKDYWQMDPARVVDFLENHCTSRDGKLVNSKTGRRVKAVLPVHILGHPVDMDALLECARRFDLTVIEDATESLGATYRGRHVGALGDISCLSFNGNKVITTGGGGMVLTNNSAWAEKARYLTTQAKDDAVEYVHGEIGYNYRLTNIQAAMGCAQMEQLQNFIEKKRQIARSYAAAFDSVPGISCMRQAPWATSINWLSTILVDESKYGEDSRLLMHRLATEGIQTRPLWQPLHKSPACAGMQSQGGDVAEEINNHALSLPSSVGLTTAELQRVINAVTKSH